MPDSHRASGELLAQFDMLFESRRDAHGTVRPDGSVECVRAPWGAAELAAHLSSDRPLALYPVLDNGTCWWACLDLDYPGDPAAAEEAATRVRGVLEEAGAVAWLERSMKKGAHVWTFFAEPVPASLARGLLNLAVRAARLPAGVPGGGIVVEVFPKQERLRPGHVGNCVTVPYRGDAPPSRCTVLDGSGRELTAEEFAAAALGTRISAERARAAAGRLMDALEPGRLERARRPLPPETAEKIARALAAHWRRGARNFLALGIAGLLARQGYSRDSAKALLRDICARAADEEAPRRADAADRTYGKLEAGEEVAGWAHLAPHLPDEVLGAVRRALSEAAERERAMAAAETEVVLVDGVAIPAFTRKPPVAGLLKEICDHFALSTDANLEVRCAAALVLVSMLVGRVCLREGERRTYPNLWLLVVGPSSDTRKSTLQDLTRRLWRRVAEDPPASERLVRPPREPREVPGLKDDNPEEIGTALARDPFWDDDASPEALAHKLALVSVAADECRFALFTDEAGHYLQALEKKDYMATAAGKYLKLYDCPAVTTMDRRQSSRLSQYRAHNVFMCWFLVTTPAALLQASLDNLKYTGFFQRCLLVPAGPREREPEDFQPPVLPEVSAPLVEKLRKLIPAEEREAVFSDGAKEVYRGFISEFRRFRAKNPHLAEAEMLARLDSHVKKLALLMQCCLEAENGSAAGSGSGEPDFGELSDLLLNDEPRPGPPRRLVVSAEAAERAVGLARYFWEATSYAAAHLLSTSEFMQLRQVVVDALMRKGGKATQRELLRMTKMRLKEFEEVLETLVARGEITVDESKKEGRGRKTKHISLARSLV